MFQRRQKKSWAEKAKNVLWPQGGWQRYGRYLMLRLNRLKGTPRSIAAGLACGVAVSFTGLTKKSEEYFPIHFTSNNICDSAISESRKSSDENLNLTLPFL